MAEHRTRRARTGAAVLVLTVLGLVGMHSLPDAMVSSAGTMSMSRPPAGAPSPAVGMSLQPGARRQARVADPVAHPSDGQTSGDARAVAPRVGAPIGCAMDHTNCVAVQRESAHLTVPDTALTTAAAPEPLSAPSAATAASRNPRAPPDLSLVALGISRT